MNQPAERPREDDQRPKPKPPPRRPERTERPAEEGSASVQVEGDAAADRGQGTPEPPD